MLDIFYEYCFVAVVAGDSPCCILAFDSAINKGFHYTGCNGVNNQKTDGSRGVIVSKLDKQIFTGEFEYHWVPLFTRAPLVVSWLTN